MRLHELQQPDYDIQSRYDFFNRSYFGGQLPTIPMGFATLKKRAGHVKYAVKGIKNIPSTHKLVPGSMTLALSNTHIRTPEHLDAILLHEMIHVYLLSTGDLVDDHGPNFEALRKQLEKKSGIAIPRTEATEGLEFAAEAQPVCVLLLTVPSNDRKVYALLNKTWVLKNERALREYFNNGKIYIVKSKLWTEKRFNSKEQRPSRMFKMNKYYATPEEVADLEQNGKIISQWNQAQ